MKSKQNFEWKNQCDLMPKLRTSNWLKDFSAQASYLIKPITFHQRKTLANIRVGSFKNRVETPWYFRPKVPYKQRYCVTCPNEDGEIESESHYLIYCTAYDKLRQAWLSKLEIPEEYTLMSLNSPTNIIYAANYIFNALKNTQ